MQTSKSFQLNSSDMKSLGRGLVIAFAGALLTYLQSLNFDFGQYTIVAVSVNSILVNFIRLYLQNNQS